MKARCVAIAGERRRRFAGEHLILSSLYWCHDVIVLISFDRRSASTILVAAWMQLFGALHSFSSWWHWSKWARARPWGHYTWYWRISIATKRVFDERNNAEMTFMTPMASGRRLPIALRAIRLTSCLSDEAGDIASSAAVRRNTLVWPLSMAYTRGRRAFEQSKSASESQFLPWGRTCHASFTPLLFISTILIVDMLTQAWKMLRAQAVDNFINSFEPARMPLLMRRWSNLSSACSRIKEACRLEPVAFSTSEWKIMGDTTHSAL